MVARVEEYGKKKRTWKRMRRTRKRLNGAAIDVFSEKPVGSVVGKQVSIYLSLSTNPMKIRRLARAVAGFVFGFFSSATIGVTSDEIETNLKPLRRPFIRSLCAF